VGGVIIGVSLGFFGWHHRALGPNRKGQSLFLRKTRRKYASNTTGL